MFGKGDLFGHLKSVLDFLVPESLRFAESIALQTASIIYLFILTRDVSRNELI